MSNTSRFYILFFAISAIFLAPLHANSDDEAFIWPVRAPKYVSASFGEPRPGRFHMGLDFKTGGAVGKEVYAVGDGQVVRIRTSPFGYGKSLYVKLDTGQTVLYGHLSKFTDEIENELFTMRLNKGSYDINWYPKAGRFLIKAGEVIARSGDTGGGGAHLHLEIRDRNNAPENPLKYGFPVRDTIKPVMGAVLLIPLDAASSVNGLSRSFVLDFKNNSSAPVLITGRVGLAVAGYDRANNAKNKLGLYHVAMSIDSTEVFSKTYDSLRYDEDRFGGFDNFPGRQTNGNGYLSALFRQTGNTIDIYEGDGVLSAESLSPGGHHDISILGVDFMGNESRRSFAVAYGHMPVLASAEFESGNKIAVVGYYSFGELESLVIDRALEDGSYVPVVELPLSGSSYDETIDIGDAEGGEGASFRLQLVADSKASRPVYINRPEVAQEGNGSSALTIDSQLIHDRVVVDVTSKGRLSSHPVITVLREIGRASCRERVYC